MLGEILMQIGVAVSASNTFVTPWDHTAWLSPAFTFFILTRVSGIPMLEERAWAKWGHLAEYRAYLERTSALVPGTSIGDFVPPSSR